MSAARYTGVQKTKGRRTYTASVSNQGKNRYIGSYATPQEAARVYDEACICMVSLQNQGISAAVYVTYIATQTALLLLVLSHLQLLLPQHLQAVNHRV